jgi:glycosyltransferase involved in cell wall biosynthesis
VKLRAQPCVVVYDGLPIPTLPSESDRQQAKRELDLSGDKTTVLFAGQIIERKGVADLLRGWDELPAHCREMAELVIVGDDLENDGAYRREMEQLAYDLGHRVRFLGFQSNVPRWLTAADIVLVPSHAEPLGNATLEAMAHGRPVLGSNVGGIPEMIEHGVTGLIVPPKSPTGLACAMERLILDRQEREALGDAARRDCEDRFSLSNHVDKVVKHYEHAIADYGRTD